jgi:hypothetical protein
MRMGKEEPDTVKAKRHTPNQVIAKLREAERMLGEGKSTAEVAKAPGRGSVIDPEPPRSAVLADPIRAGAVAEGIVERCESCHEPGCSGRSPTGPPKRAVR